MSEKPSPKRSAEILDAAAQVFAEKGYHGATTKDIADRLGIQQAGIYHYFKSKDAALAEVCRLGVAGYVERLKEISKSDQSPAEKIKQAVMEHMRPFHRIRHHVRVFHQERRYLVGDNREQVAGLSRTYEAELQKIFRQGVKDGSFRADLDCRLATLALLGMSNSVATWYRGSTESEIEVIAASYAEIIINGTT